MKDPFHTKSKSLPLDDWASGGERENLDKPIDRKERSQKWERNSIRLKRQAGERAKQVAGRYVRGRFPLRKYFAYQLRRRLGNCK